MANYYRQAAGETAISCERIDSVEKVLQGGTIVDPSQRLHGRYDLLIRDGLVAEIAEKISARGRKPVDVSGSVLTPGLIDLHTHLREPGEEHKETVLTACAAAVAGGYTAVTAMPNTNPVTDDAGKVRHIKRLAAKAGLARVFPVGAVTKGLQGRELSGIAAMVSEGACAVTDDGRGVQDSGLLRQALQVCARCDIPLLEHCEDETLAGCGQVHEGEIAEKLGLPGIPASSETVMVARDALLSAETGAHVHFMHVSSASSVEIIRLAKKYQLNVTAEATPHHLLLSEAAADGYNTAAKMKPPLRSEADRQALVQALAENIIDVVATDHAPHAEVEKEQDFTAAPFGVVGLETAFPLLYTYLVRPGIITLDRLVAKMSCRPAEILKLPYGTLAPGSPADIAAFNLQEERTIDSNFFCSKGKNTPFHGWKVYGFPVMTIVGGRVVMRDGVINYGEGLEQ